MSLSTCTSCIEPPVMLWILIGLSWIHSVSELPFMTVCKSELDTGNILGYPGQMLQTLKHRLLASAGAQVKRSRSWLSFSWNREMILDCFYFHPMTIYISLWNILTLPRWRPEPQRTVSQLWILTIRLEKQVLSYLLILWPYDILHLG